MREVASNNQFHKSLFNFSHEMTFAQSQEWWQPKCGARSVQSGPGGGNSVGLGLEGA